MQMLPTRAIEIVFREAVFFVTGDHIGGIGLNQAGIKTREAVDQ